jgi:hypothetical protein
MPLKEIRNGGFDVPQRNHAVSYKTLMQSPACFLLLTTPTFE